MKSALLALGVLGISACSSVTGSSGEVKTIDGRVRFYSIEGGFYAIRGNDSVTYDPTNLNKDFQLDGLHVRAQVRVRNDVSGTHMAGPIVDILQLTTLDPIALR